MQVGHAADHRVGDVFIEAGHQRAIVHVVNGAAIQRFRAVGQVDLHVPVQQAGVQQVKVAAVRLDVGHHAAQHGLSQLLRVVIDVLHVALVHAEHTEAGVQLGIGVLGFDLVTGAADALLADFADGLVAHFIGFTCFIALFGKLHHDKLAVSAVLGVELHDGVSGCGRAGEKVKNYGIVICYSGNPFNESKLFRIIKGSVELLHH